MRSFGVGIYSCRLIHSHSTALIAVVLVKFLSSFNLATVTSSKGRINLSTQLGLLSDSKTLLREVPRNQA